MRRSLGAVLAWAMPVPAALVLWGCDGSGTVIAPAGPARAAQLAQVWARHVGAPQSELDASGDMALGGSGIAYDPARDTLYGRVWINMALTKSASPEQLAVLRRMVVALNDPKIGGMYDRAGGYFVLDEQREGYFLVRAFPVAQTEPDKLVRDMERMQAVAARWTTKWLLDVAMIMHGKEPAPTHPIALDN
jgi:hypothetical protein